MWNNILSTRSSSRCHLRKVAYLKWSCLVLSALSLYCLYWKRSVPVESGLWDNERSVMPTDHLHLWLVIVIKRAEFDRWPHVILTSGHWYQKYSQKNQLHQQAFNQAYQLLQLLEAVPFWCLQVTKKFSNWKQAHLGKEPSQNQPNKMGTISQHIYNIPTSCAILPTMLCVC